MQVNSFWYNFDAEEKHSQVQRFLFIVMFEMILELSTA